MPFLGLSCVSLMVWVQFFFLLSIRLKKHKVFIVHCSWLVCVSFYTALGAIHSNNTHCDNWKNQVDKSTEKNATQILNNIKMEMKRKKMYENKFAIFLVMRKEMGYAKNEIGKQNLPKGCQIVRNKFRYFISFGCLSFLADESKKKK